MSKSPPLPPLNATTGASPLSTSTKAATPLPGRYKTFFEPRYHDLVSQYYHERANSTQRHEFKRLVKSILAFNPEEAKAKLRVGFAPSIAPAHAVLMHNGAQFINAALHDNVVLYLALSKSAETEAFRTAFGLILPPTTTSMAKTHYASQYSEGTKYMKGELMLRDTSQTMFGKKHVQPLSASTTAPCEVIGDGKSQYGLFYAWKVAPPQGASVSLKAVDSSVHGAPWGEYGGTNWVPQTKDDFADHEYRGPKIVGVGRDAQVIVEARRFQNYNDNLSHDVYRTERMLRKQRRLPGQGAAEATLNATHLPASQLMKPHRATAPPSGPSPVFCR